MLYIYIVAGSQIQILISELWSFFFPNVFNPQLVESSNVEPMGVEG